MTTTTTSTNQVKTFKKILVYFVKHMVYRCKGLPIVIPPSIKFSTDEQIKVISGQGYNDGKIQTQMEEIAQVKDENVFQLGDGFNNQRLCISIYGTNKDVHTSYLHIVSIKGKDIYTKEDDVTEDAWTNINPKFKEEGGKKVFYGLEVRPSQNSPTYSFPPLEYTFDELGLNISQCTEGPNHNLKAFYDYFMEMRKAELMGTLTYKGKEQLLATHNMILTGAPGTGKTWSAMNIAAWIICGKSYKTVMDENGNTKDKQALHDRCELVQFHPSYDYTDFVEGLRPKSKNDDSSSEHVKNDSHQSSSSSSDIGFELKNGVFRKFCAKALNHIDNNYVFIIDEINRGELSKIFGELFFSIDPGYRGPKGAVLTQYANMSNQNEFDKKLNLDSMEYGHFFVPENVYIIGTMNDIDRSVESMDFAMRRRFSFIEVKANEREDMWTKDWKDIAKICMEAVNKEIESMPGLSSAYHIGPAYFNKLEYYPIITGGNDFFKLWDNHLYGVIYEYLRGKKEPQEIINKIHDKYLDALCEAIKARYNYGGRWGKKLISQAKNASSIDSSITSEGTAKVYLDKFKNLSYNSYNKTNDRSKAIFILSNDIKKYLAIGKRIEDL